MTDEELEKLHNDAMHLAHTGYNVRESYIAGLRAVYEKGRADVTKQIQIIGEYKDDVTGRRCWWSGGTWLYPGELVAVIEPAPPQRAAPLATEGAMDVRGKT